MHTWKMMGDFYQVRQMVQRDGRFQMSHVRWILDLMQGWGLVDGTGISPAEVAAVARQLHALKTFMDRSGLPVDLEVRRWYAALANGPVGGYVDRLNVQQISRNVARSGGAAAGAIPVVMFGGGILEAIAAAGAEWGIAAFVGAAWISGALLVVFFLASAALLFDRWAGDGRGFAVLDYFADAVTTRVAVASWYLIAQPYEPAAMLGP